MTGSSTTCAGLALLSLVLSQSCESLPLLAPTDSTIVLISSQGVIPLDGESVITALVTESVGTAVPNGTLVTFSTTLGIIEPAENRTQDGRASTRFRAGRTPGTAAVLAVSGTATSNTLDIQIRSTP